MPYMQTMNHLLCKSFTDSVCIEASRDCPIILYGALPSVLPYVINTKSDMGVPEDIFEDKGELQKNLEPDIKICDVTNLPPERTELASRLSFLKKTKQTTLPS